MANIRLNPALLKTRWNILSGENIKKAGCLIPILMIT